MDTNKPSSKYCWRFERNVANTVQSKKLAPKIPPLEDAQCNSPLKNCDARNRTSLQPRKYPIQSGPCSSAAALAPARKKKSIQLLESQRTKDQLLDSSQFSFRTPKKQITSCSIYSYHTKPMPCFPTLPMRREDLNKGMQFALLPRPSLKPRMKRRSPEVITVNGIQTTPASDIEFNL